MFAHTHGFYVKGVYIPREIFVAPVSENPEFIEGFVVRVDLRDSLPEEETTNKWVHDNMHGMHARSMVGQVHPSRVGERLRRIVGDETVYVKGPSQTTFFKNYLTKVVNADDFLPKIKDLCDIPIPPQLLDTDHLVRYHSRRQRDQCGQIICFKCAKHLHVKLEEIDERRSVNLFDSEEEESPPDDEEWWDV